MGQHDRLIDHLFEKGERALVRAWSDRCTRGMRDDQVAAILHEFASVPENQSGEHAVRYMADFMRNIGIPDYQVQPFRSWIDAGAPGWEPTPEPSSAEPPAGEQTQAQAPQQPPAPAPVPAAAPAGPVGPTREQLQATIKQHERNMRAPEGSEAWREYWRDGGSQEYHAALTAQETASLSPAPVPLAAEPAAPAP
jgi:hypothetical protein